jgi:hypothetical protein
MPAGVAVLERLRLAEAVGGAPFYGLRYHFGKYTAEGRFPRARGIPIAGRGQRRKHLGRGRLRCRCGGRRRALRFTCHGRLARRRSLSRQREAQCQSGCNDQKNRCCEFSMAYRKNSLLMDAG